MTVGREWVHDIEVDRMAIAEQAERFQAAAFFRRSGGIHRPRAPVLSCDGVQPRWDPAAGELTNQENETESCD